MKYGPAATHGIEVHNTQPGEVRLLNKNKTKTNQVFFSSDQGKWIEVEEGFPRAPALFHVCGMITFSFKCALEMELTYLQSIQFLTKIYSVEPTQ